jgi:hypothetical protein
MTYTIDYLVNACSTGSELWAGSLSEARHLAQAFVASGTAEQVHISDDEGRLIYQHPRTLRTMPIRGEYRTEPVPPVPHCFTTRI